MEYGGLIYQSIKDHSYAITVPITNNKLGGLQVPLWVRIEGYKFVADYHTHVCDAHYYPQYFSPSDVAGNKHIHDIGFMADLCNGNVHEFNPAKDVSNDVSVEGIDDASGEATVAHITGGRIVGHFPVTPTPQSIWGKFNQLRRPIHPNITLEVEIDNTHPALSDHPYETMQDAAIDGLKQSAKLNRSFEAGGLVIHDHRDDKYYITIPFNSDSPGMVVLPFAAYKEWDIVGTYHTHACAPHYIHGYFSVPDTAEGQFYRVNMYMMNMCKGNVYVYDYRVDKADDYQPMIDGAKLVMTRGRLIGWLDLTIKD